MYVRNCDFRYSTSADILLDAQANSVKRCVSIGSASFISMSTVGGPYNGSTTGDPRDWGHTTGAGGAPFGPATVAGNTVVDWTGPAAIVYPGRGPLMLYDNSFSRPGAEFPPLLMATSPKLQVIPTPLHVLGRISPIFSPFFPVFCAFSPSRRGGSNELQAGTQGQGTVARAPKHRFSGLANSECWERMVVPLHPGPAAARFGHPAAGAGD